MIKVLLSLVLASFFAFPALGGVQVKNTVGGVTTDLKVTNTLICQTGITCAKGTKGTITVSGTGVGGYSAPVTATATTLTAAQCGSTFVNAGAIEVELPEASTVLGCTYTFIVGNASNFTIDPDAGDQIFLLTNAAGDSLIADAVGESLVLRAISASGWAPVGAEKGTWTDSN
ncbi:MAG: hypothetical protein ACRCV5_16505 [Afipia sp.]